MKILGLIPARGGSRGVPGKNIKPLNGKPLIAYTIEAALKSSSLNRLIVSTDDADIAEISKKYGAEVPFKRPAELATDTSPSIDTVMHALDFFSREDVHFDAVCLLQPTVPFRAENDIDSAIQKFINTEADSLISVREVPHEYNPYWTFVAQSDSDFLCLAVGETKIISRRQDLPRAYYRDGAVYITRTGVIQNRRSLYGNRIAYFESTGMQAVNIDTREDWQNAQKMATNYGS